MVRAERLAPSTAATSATASKLFGEPPELWGYVMVAMCERADAEGCFFGMRVAPRLLEYTSLYTAAQRDRIANAGFTVPSPAADDPGDDDGSGGSGGSDGAVAASSIEDDQSLQFWGACGKRRLVAQLCALAGPDREFALHKPKKGSTLKRRRRLMGTATFSCAKCHIRHVTPMTRLARVGLTPDAFKCLCSTAFSARDALSRRTGTSWRNICTFVKSQRPDTELVTTHDTFTKDYSSLVLRCKRCRREKRVQPRDVFGPEAQCAACATPAAP